MIRCPSCNCENLPQARFCDNCGATLTQAPSAGKVIGSWIIGSSPVSDLVVNNPLVSSRHCHLTEVEGGFLLEDLGSTNGTYVNGVRISGAVGITKSDRVTLGLNQMMPWPCSEGPGQKTINIGREADNHIVLDYPIVSGHHARIMIQGNTAIIEDLGSTNGTAIGNPSNRISSSPVTPQDTVYFGSLALPASKLLSGTVAMGEKPHTLLEFKGESMALGRDPYCDKPLDHPRVSWRHAKINRTPRGFEVEDLGSTNGTFLNGQRIYERVAVKAGDIIGLGSYTFVFTSEGNLEQRDYRGNVTLEARGVCVSVKRKRLVDDVSLTIYPSEIVALMGPSGAGKTTLMNALNGYTPPSTGSVLINGKDLYKNYEQFCAQIGYVPQDDIMHRDLTVGQALYYTARLRLPSDFTDAGIKTRIEHVLSLLGLEGTENVIIGSPEKKGISGGQRKRVNLAMELITDPSVLFLDEPTSGLSSEDALMVMQVLRKLADEGKTILITIHQPGLEVFRMMDNLVMISKDRKSVEAGRMVYFGPAYPDSIEFFNPGGVKGARPGVEPAPDEALRGLGKDNTRSWLNKFNSSGFRKIYVDDRAGKYHSAPVEPVAGKIKRKPGLNQWWTLVRRCFAIKIKDKWNTCILLAQAPIIASLIVLVFGSQAEMEVSPSLGKTFAALFLMIISSLWLGCSNAVREIVGEWAVYHRERMVNLKIPSYLASKYTVLGALCVIQCLILFGIISRGCKLKGPYLPMLLLLILTSLVALALGLTLSAIARTSEVSIALVPVVLLPMVFLAGLLSPLHQMKEAARPIASFIPARWSFEGLILEETQDRCWKWKITPPGGIAAVEVKCEETEDTAAPAPEDMTYLSGDAARKRDDELINMPGTVEYIFPRKDRYGPANCGLILAAMLVSGILVILSVLRIRDVH